jgi:hypothetical protein
VVHKVVVDCRSCDDSLLNFNGRIHLREKKTNRILILKRKFIYIYIYIEDDDEEIMKTSYLNFSWLHLDLKYIKYLFLLLDLVFLQKQLSYQSKISSNRDVSKLIWNFGYSY